MLVLERTLRSSAPHIVGRRENLVVRILLEAPATAKHPLWRRPSAIEAPVCRSVPEITKPLLYFDQAIESWEDHISQGLSK